MFESIWLVFRTGGPLVGGAIVLALNQYTYFSDLSINTLIDPNSGANEKGKGKVGPSMIVSSSIWKFSLTMCL